MEKLPCHLPDEQFVIFQEDEAQETVQRRPTVTDLMAYFETDRTDPSARTTLYPDFPHYFTLNSKERLRQRRKRGTTSHSGDGEVVGDALGHIPTVSSSAHQPELHCLRMYCTAGAQSLDDLRTIDGQLCPTSHDACRGLGLLEGDTEGIVQ